MDSPHRNGNRRSLVFKFFTTTVDDLQHGNSVKAEETLQKTQTYFQGLTPSELSKPSLKEIEIVNEAEEISVKNVGWSFQTGAILLAQKSTENYFFVRFASAFSAVALNMLRVDIAEQVLEQSIKYIKITDDEESDNILGVALNNLGCVYIGKGFFQKANDCLQKALERFKVVKEAKTCVTVDEKIVTVCNNLRLVHQAQRNFVADQQLRNDLLASLSQVALQPRIIAVVNFNEACTSLENRNFRKALNEFEKLKTFCETELHQTKELLTCISLKICLVSLMLNDARKAATIIDTISTLPELIELVDVKTNFSLDLLGTIAETVADIYVYQGNLDIVCKYFSYLVTVVRERCGANHPTVASILFKQGLVFSHMEDVVRSRQCLTDALHIFFKTFGAVHPSVLKCNASLAKLESRDGFQGKSLLHSERVLENVEEICQVSFLGELKTKFLETFQESKIPFPEKDQEKQLKLESLVSEFGVEISSVLSQHQPSDLGDGTVSLLESHNCFNSTVSLYAEEISGKLSLNCLKVGICLFKLGVAAQSTAFLLLSCTYAKMFHDYLDCSDVILVQVIFVVCQLKSIMGQNFSRGEQLKNEFTRLKNFIEQRIKRSEQQPESKTLFFDESVNLKVSLALILRSFVEMEMYEMVDVVYSLFSLISNQPSEQMTHVSLVGELRFAFCSSRIQCLGKSIMHDLIFSTPLGMMYKNKITEVNDTHAACQRESKKHQKPFHKCETSVEKQPREIFKTLAIKSDNSQWQRSCRFLVDCPISHGIDIGAMKQINVCSVKAIQHTVPQLILPNRQDQLLLTQYYMELEPLVSTETVYSSILDDFSVLPLVLSTAEEGTESETQSLVFVNTERTCEGSVTFILQDKVTAMSLFGNLLKLVLTNEDKLGEVVNVGIEDNQLVLKLQRPPLGQIVMQCFEDSIKVKTQLIHCSRSHRKVEIGHEEIPPCKCSLIEEFFTQEMEKCTRSSGILFHRQIEKACCISSISPDNRSEMSASVSVIFVVFFTELTELLLLRYIHKGNN